MALADMIGTGEAGYGSPLSVVAVPEHLADVTGAREHWEGARDREQLARAVMLAAVEDARTMGATLREIATALGTSRQYVQKLLRESERIHAEDEAVRRRYAPDNARGRISDGIRPQCSGCKRFLKRRDEVCPGCGYAGHGGYVGVPAQTSHLERYR